MSNGQGCAPSVYAGDGDGVPFGAGFKGDQWDLVWTYATSGPRLYYEDYEADKEPQWPLTA